MNTQQRKELQQILQGETWNDETIEVAYHSTKSLEIRITLKALLYGTPLSLAGRLLLQDYANTGE